MKLPARWTNPEGWDFHIKDTGIIRECIGDIERGEEINFERFDGMVFKREWMEDHGEGNPPNYNLLKELAEKYLELVHDGEFPKMSLIEKMIYQKWIFYSLTKFKQDTAYREIMGGWLTVLILDPSPWISAETKEDRVAYFERQQKWLDTSYKRERTKPWVMMIINEFLKRYMNSEFVEASANWVYDRLVERRKEWQLIKDYDPQFWYPIGRGQIQNKIRGGRG